MTTLVGCDPGASTATEAPPARSGAATVAAVAGVYALTQFNGVDVPYTTYDHPPPLASRVEVIGGTLAVGEGGTFRLQIDRRLTDGAGTRTYPHVSSGSVSRRGDTLTLTPDNTLPAFPGFVAGGAITLTGGTGSRPGRGDQLTFRR